MDDPGDGDGDETRTAEAVETSEAHDGPPDDARLQVVVERPWELIEIDRPGSDAPEVTRLEIPRQPPPDFQAQLSGYIHGVDAEQAHAAQDERQHRRLHVNAGGHAHTGDIPPELGRARQPGEQLAADVVDGARPLRLFERARPKGDLIAHEHASRAEPLQILFGGALAAHRDNLIAAPCQHVRRKAAHAAARAGDHDLAILRLLAVLLDAMNRQGRREPGGAQRHAL